MPSIYDIALKTLEGKAFSHDLIKNKVVLIVNTASKCGYTSQYAGLESLYKKHKDAGLVILGFPCNQFGGQEPGSSTEISEFCQRKYGVSFPMLEKNDVNGAKEHPLYSFLKKSKPSDIGWNFEKFLIGKDGQVVSRHGSGATPASLEAEIGKLL